MQLSFYKYQGTGNDFIMVDDRQQTFPKNNTKFIEQLCDRRFGIGADGMILLQNDEQVDFRMIYFNSDGSESSMCGNGGRCLVAFAKYLKLIDDKATFIAVDGLHHATIVGSEVSLQMIDVPIIEDHPSHVFLDTGSPHHVEFEDNLEALDIQTEGATIRYGEPYNEEGSNVNFVKQLSDNNFAVRTYERGVEAETFSCGTGVTAVALAMHHLGKATTNEVHLNTKGGALTVSFEKNGLGYKNIFLKGPAKQVYKGTIAWER